MIDNNKKTHLIVTGRGGVDQVQADWNQTDTEQPDYIKNKPELAAVATSGSYNDLTDKPTIPTQVQADWNETNTTAPSYIQNKPTILTQWFGTQAEYDLIDPKDPNVIYNIEGSDNVQADWNQSDSSADDYIKNKPTIPAAQVNSDWNAVSGVAQILNKPSIPANTSDLNNDSGFITINDVPAQVNADWNSNSGASQILNKPTIPTVPAMATETLTFTLQGGTTKTIEFYTVPNYFYVEDISSSDNTLSITKSSASAPTIEVFCSTDKANWTSMGTTDTTAITATIPANGKLYLKCTATKWGSSNNVYNAITTSGIHNVGGNTMSLLYGDNFENQTSFPANSAWCLSGLFKNSTKLTSAVNLQLPATDLTGANDCYANMFDGCTALTTAPALPATTLSAGCYGSMFRGCTSLTTAPALPATDLTGVNDCYANMFDGCTALTTAPALPATTLSAGCYGSMFRGCTSLTTAPALPATDLTGVNDCYANMFDGCTALTTAPALPATTLSAGCYNSMFRGCTSLTTAPALPAMNAQRWCYNSMFNGCTSLTTAPALPATTIGDNAYNGMFNGCRVLTTAPALPATDLTGANNCYQYMFSGCTSLTTAPALPATTLARSCYQSMFNGCTSLTTAPALPATALTMECYREMFRGCTSLTTAPVLNATSLPTYCYYEMFRDCSNLNSVTTYATDISASACTSNWLSNVSATGDFFNLGSATYTADSASGIPSGWTVHTSL